MPTLANNLVWRSIYLADGRIHSDRIRVGFPPTVKPGTSLPLVTTNDLNPMEQRGLKDFQRFAWFSDRWVARAPSEPSVLADMRYSKSADAFDPIWGIQFTDTNGQVKVQWVDRTRQRRIKVGELWSEITGKHPGYSSVEGAGPTR
jgi:hypothetical protein